jgi:RNA polymerase sigma-70 factor, ECF subfamily
VSAYVGSGGHAESQDISTHGIEALYDVHGAVCYLLARRMLVDAHLAEDLMQDVFLAVWAGRAGIFDPTRGSMREWLLHITHHGAVDKVRRNERHASRNAGSDMFASRSAPYTPVTAARFRAPATCRRRWLSRWQPSASPWPDSA